MIEENHDLVFKKNFLIRGGQKIRDAYQFNPDEPLGSGSFGTVVLGI